jgi:hypothetical protein
VIPLELTLQACDYCRVNKARKMTWEQLLEIERKHVFSAGNLPGLHTRTAGKAAKPPSPFKKTRTRRFPVPV